MRFDLRLKVIVCRAIGAMLLTLCLGALPGPAALASETDGTPATQAEILDWQIRLQALNYGTGTPDGKIGPRTRGSISAFQAHLRLPVTGIMDDATEAALMAAMPGVAPTEVTDPSFDCGRASTPTELAICASPDLAAKDRALAAAYSAALAVLGDELRAGQSAWLKSRNSCGGNGLCLADSMNRRIVDLQGLVPAGTAGGGETGKARAGQMQVADGANVLTDGRVRLALNTGALSLVRDGTLTSAGQSDLLHRQRLGLGGVDEILSTPFATHTLAEIYRSLQPSALRDLYVEVYQGNGDQDWLRNMDALVAQGSWEGSRGMLVNWPFTSVRFEAPTPSRQIDEFELARLIAAIRRDLPGHLRTVAVPNPLAVTAVCGIAIGPYDFTQQAFALSSFTIRSECFAESEGDSGQNRGFGDQNSGYVARLPAVADWLPIPIEEAEAFRNRVGDWALLTLPASLSVSMETVPGMAARPSYILEAEGAFTLHGGELQNALHRWSEETVAQAPPGEADWVTMRGEMSSLGPMIADADTVFLLRLKLGLQPSEQEWRDALAVRLQAEDRQDRTIMLLEREGTKAAWTDPWPRFFPVNRPRDLMALQPEFEEWSRARVAVMPSQII
jgi:uncharacterized protein YecT (DUF1311 family)